ncbi:MAG: cytochrome c family protein [Pseudomonas sp.]|jgi:cytochrome c|nr:cytochrome c family protein [Pseudomonas sp.]
MKTAALFICGLLACNFALADAEAGKAVFTKLCSGCHKIGPSARNAFGPPLTGIVGKHAGEQPGYVYTSGMKDSGIVWTRDKISELVEDPSGVVPGTRMKLWWMGSDQRMEDLLDYLEASQADAAN